MLEVSLLKRRGLRQAAQSRAKPVVVICLAVFLRAVSASARLFSSNNYLGIVQGCSSLENQSHPSAIRPWQPWCPPHHHLANMGLLARSGGNLNPDPGSRVVPSLSLIYARSASPTSDLSAQALLVQSFLFCTSITPAFSLCVRITRGLLLILSIHYIAHQPLHTFQQHRYANTSFRQPRPSCLSSRCWGSTSSTTPPSSPTTTSLRLPSNAWSSSRRVWPHLQCLSPRWRYFSIV